MPDAERDVSAIDTERLMNDVTGVVQHIGQALNMASLYGVAHRVAQASFERTHQALTAFLEQHGAAQFNVAEGDLLVNSAAVSSRTPLAGALVKRLTSLNLSSFVIEPGLGLDEFQGLLALLLQASMPGAPAEKSGLFAARGFQHIQARATTYRQVGEDEQVIRREEAESLAQVEAADSTPGASAADLDNVVAFLKGDAQTEPAVSPEALREIASDSEKMAEMILRAVELRQQMADVASGESLADLVVGCIQRVTNQIVRSPETRTQRGRKQVKRSLLMLEQSLIERLHAMAGGGDAEAAVAAAVEDAVGDLDMEALASKYMKDRRAAEKSEGRLRRVIERAAGDASESEELRRRLLEQGLAPQGWQELVLTRGDAAAPALAESAGIAEIKAVTALLDRLSAVLSDAQALPADAEPATVRDMVAEAGQQVAALAAATEEKISSLCLLADAAGLESGTDAGRRVALSHKALMSTLAEIAQELSQPLSVVIGSVNMLQTGRAGPTTATQVELLGLTASSSERLAHLVRHLKKVAGLPSSLRPDQKTLGSIYAG